MENHDYVIRKRPAGCHAGDYASSSTFRYQSGHGPADTKTGTSWKNCVVSVIKGGTMYGELKNILEKELKSMREAGLYKEERILLSPQRADIQVKQGKVVNFCANNYLGLANSPDLIASAQSALKEWGYGLSSVRFICGTTDIHKRLEATVARFLGMEDAILYSSCFDANGGLFEKLLGEKDAIISDE